MRKFNLSCQNKNIDTNNIILKTNSFKISFDNFILHVPELFFEKGKLYLLVGNNGTGKTSFLKALAGLGSKIHLRDISFFENNKDIALNNLTQKERAKLISYMPQVYNTPELSVFNFILHARYPYMKSFLGFDSEDIKLVDRVIEDFKLTYIRTHLFSSLSGGEQLKVLMARISVLDSNVVLFDEPTSFLDKVSRQEFIHFVSNLKAKGKVVLIVSHDDYLFKDIVDTHLMVDLINSNLT